MDVTAAGLDQFLNHTPFNIDDIGGERVRIGINRLRCLVIETLNDPVRPDEAHLHRFAGDGAGAFVLGERNVVHEVQPRFGRSSVRYRRAGLGEIGNFPAPQRRATLGPAYMGAQSLGGAVEAADCKSETVLKVEAADFAVGNDVEPDRFLQSDKLADACTLDLQQPVCAKRFLVIPLSRFPP